jgi:hypothetical protein
MGAIEDDFTPEDVVAGVLDHLMNGVNTSALQGVAADGPAPRS